MPEQNIKAKIIKKSLWLWGAFFLLAAIVWFWQLRLAPSRPTPFAGGYFYENKGLGFSVDLPASFKYFQTQRQKGEDYVEIEFFVPTADRYYHQLVPGYAQPFVVRVINKKDWPSYQKQEIAWEMVGQKGDRAYIVSFWQKVPSDWQAKWNSASAAKIKKAIKIN